MEFRAREKARRVEALEAEPELPPHTTAYLTQLFYPKTPDVTVRGRRAGAAARRAASPEGDGEGDVAEEERKLHTKFKLRCRFGPKASLPSPSPHSRGGPIYARAHTHTNRLPSDTSAVPPPPALDLRAFLTLLRDVGLLPAPVAGPGGAAPSTLQYPLAVMAFKQAQRERAAAGARDKAGELGWVGAKHAMFLMLTEGPRELRRRLAEKEGEAAQLRARIVREVPRWEDPTGALRGLLGEVFDTIFEAFIFFDLAGDWQVT